MLFLNVFYFICVPAVTLLFNKHFAFKIETFSDCSVVNTWSLLGDGSVSLDRPLALLGYDALLSKRQKKQNKNKSAWHIPARLPLICRGATPQKCPGATKSFNSICVQWWMVEAGGERCGGVLGNIPEKASHEVSQQNTWLLPT